MPWHSSLLANPAAILAFLEQDRLYAAYAIGDLEPAFYEQCTWAQASRDGHIRALALHYLGLRLPALLLVGHPEGLEQILQRVLYPGRAYLTCQSDHLAVVERFYAWEETVPMWRMVVRAEDWSPVPGGAQRLGPEHERPLIALYAHGGGAAFTAQQLRQGVFYGILEEGRLVAAAGTHLVSPTYGVAAVGNVFTHPAHRGRGHASAATSAVVAELLRRGTKDIVLNVGQSNEAAIRLYEQLGFRRYCPFWEGPAHARERSTSDDPGEGQAI